MKWEILKTYTINCEKSLGQGILRGEWYHDLAKWLSHYLYFFSFSFHLIRKLTDVQEEITQRRYVGLYK